MTSLGATLEAFRSGLGQRMSDEKRELLRRAEAAVRARPRRRPELAEGSVAPDFALPDECGNRVRLSECIQEGPVVLVFVRGGWCPFCTLTLRAWQDALPALRRAGAKVLAVTPQPARGCGEIASRDMLGFRLLSDVGNRVANAYDVDFAIPAELQPFYLKLGHDLGRINGTGDWTVPLPATFVIGREMRVLRVHLGPLPHQRLEPAEALSVIRAQTSVALL